LLGLAGSANVQGEDQKKLDVLANDVFVNLLRKSGQCAVLVRSWHCQPPGSTTSSRRVASVAFRVQHEMGC
jgi:Fructose-1-6-bisphosphatase, N-terminal domain